MSVFETTAPQFETFLKSVKDHPALALGRGGTAQNTRFIPRNFLLEEHLDPSRVASYATQLPPAGPRDFTEWDSAHKGYLLRHVFRAPPAVHDYRFVPRDNPAVCPETFRAPLVLVTLQRTDLDTAFIRLVSVADIAWFSREKEDRIFSLGEQAMADLREDNPARQELSRIFGEACSGCQHRPVFAAFYEDFLDELRDPANIAWPNQLRDRLGLYQINQWRQGGLPRRVFLFLYAAKDIPRHPGEADRRPIAIPVVIDQELFEAFCSAPRELAQGRLLNLEDNAVKEPAREVLHLFMPLQIEHIFRVGQVTTPVPEDLAVARRNHLLWLQLLAARSDYASDTDADLF